MGGDHSIKRSELGDCNANRVFTNATQLDRMSTGSCLGNQGELEPQTTKIDLPVARLPERPDQPAGTPLEVT